MDRMYIYGVLQDIENSHIICIYTVSSLTGVEIQAEIILVSWFANRSRGKYIHTSALEHRSLMWAWEIVLIDQCHLSYYDYPHNICSYTGTQLSLGYR